jgi:hypothetical protein
LAAHPPQQRHQPGRKPEVPERVCPKLHLETIRRGLPPGQCHDPGIVYQQIKRMPGVHPVREVGDRCKVRQIEMFVSNLG